ncbi:hypothetical protein AAMO2058_000259700 [Amorphochlora amoebiformis]
MVVRLHTYASPADEKQSYNPKLLLPASLKSQISKFRRCVDLQRIHCRPLQRAFRQSSLPAVQVCVRRKLQPAFRPECFGLSAQAKHVSQPHRHPANPPRTKQIGKKGAALMPMLGSKRLPASKQSRHLYPSNVKFNSCLSEPIPGIKRLI